MGKCVSKGTLTQNGRAANPGQLSSCDEREWERICSNYRENNNLTGEEDAEVGYDLVCRLALNVNMNRKAVFHFFSQKL